LGLGNRIFLNDDKFMFGVNGFYDYELDYNHRRLGIGTEIKSSILELNTNRYLGLSETRVGKNNDKEVAVDGYDIELGAHVPFIPSAKIYTKIFEYEIPGGSDFEGMKYSSKIGVPNFGIDVEFGFTDYTGSEDEWFFDLVYSFGKKTSDKSFITNEAYEKISMKDNKYNKVRRENLIVKSKESFSIKAAGF
jgi:adhesin/invasin